MNLRTLLTLFAVTASTSVSFGLTLSDPFTDGQPAGGADNSGIAWYDRSANSTLPVTNDAVINSGNALELRLNNNSTTKRGFMGVLPQMFTLANAGDFIELTFDFAFIATPLTTGGNTTAPGSSSSGITFGLYNSNGTVSGGENSANQDNDYGFRADFGTGAISNTFIGKETNSATGETGTTSGGDTLTVGLSGVTTPVNINDFNKHSAQFRMTLNASGYVDFIVGYDGSTVATGQSTVPFLSFDEIMFSQASGSRFRIDNVVLQVVPEPGTAVFLLGGIALLGLRRRRRSA